MVDPSIPQHTALDWVALVVLFFSASVLLYAFWKLHEVPYHVAVKRGHPHAHGILAACLISLLTGGLIWPLTLIWAYTGVPKVNLVESQAGAAPPPETPATVGESEEETKP